MSGVRAASSWCGTFSSAELAGDTRTSQTSDSATSFAHAPFKTFAGINIMQSYAGHRSLASFEEGGLQMSKRPETEPRDPKSLTMKDIARLAGVSQSTVSRILNSAPVAVPISEKTRQRVLAAAKEYGFRPNPMARALRGAPTMLLGAIVRDITNPIFASVIDVIAQSAREKGYSVVLGHARARADEALELAAVLEARPCDSILLIGDYWEQPLLIEDLEKSDTPVVALWHGSHSHAFHSVDVDNEAGVRRALDHLTELGHTRIAFVGGKPFGDIKDREEAYRSYNLDAGRSIPGEYVQHVDNTLEASQVALDGLLRSPRTPSAIIAATDVLAIGLIGAAARHGIRVPEELSIVGFDNMPFAAATVPPLTTVHMPIEKMGEAAVELAVSVSREQTPEVRTFQPTLIVRGSTTAPAGRARRHYR
jgi:DNA-binding LacI/PurR family transcriptional regulator